MKKKFHFAVLMLALTACLGASANDARDIRDFAHASAGFATGIGGYGIWKKIMRPEDRAEAILFGALTGLLACATKEMSDVEKKSGTLRDLGVCAAGTGLSTITILTFDF